MSIELIEAAATALRTIQAPALGAYWPEQGGVYAGLVRGIDGAGDRHLIVATDPAGEFKPVKWGAYTEIAGASSKRDGRANTSAMAAAGHQVATAVLALTIGGHTDWHIGSQAEMQVAAANCPEAFDRDYYWTSTQLDSHLAFCQVFAIGNSGWDVKGSKLRVRAVRVIQLQPFNA